MSSPTIDSRLVYPDSAPEITEDFNRVMNAIDNAGSDIVPLLRVSFKMNDGTPQEAPQYVLSGEKATEPAEDPTREGFEFSGWTIEGGTASELFDFDEPITDHTVIEAAWTPVSTDPDPEP